MLKVVNVNRAKKEREELKKREEEQKNKYTYESLYQYIDCNIDSTEEYLKEIFEKEDIKERFDIDFIQFVDKVEKAWKERERMYDDYDKDYNYEYDYEEDEEEEW